jgi:hypothetical protein
MTLRTDVLVRALAGVLGLLLGLIVGAGWS